MEINHLMQSGYQLHEAEEVALKQFILLEPEPGAGEEDWERMSLRNWSASIEEIRQ